MNLSEGVYGSNSVAAGQLPLMIADTPCNMRVHTLAKDALGFGACGAVLIFYYDLEILLAGILMVNTFPQLLLAGICFFAMTTLFSFITLPVEINASQRAFVW